MNIYKKNGYKDRDNYLENLSEDYNLDIDSVYKIADTLGDSEDFDGLINMLEDFECF